jgi:thymidylate kinase
VYKIHHKPEDCGLSSLTPASLQTLHIAAHIDAIESTIIPALQGGSDIVLDRFWWSTWAYGVAANVSPKILNSLIEAERHAWGVWTPAHMFYLHRETELAQKMNEETPRILTAYTDLIEQEKHHYPVHVVKNKGSLEEVLAVLVAKVL